MPIGISVAPLSQICNTWLDVLHGRFGRLIIWPSRTSVMRNLPAAFLDPMFMNVRAILDCTEIFINKPSLLTARCQTYSRYKHHNTIKVLTAVTHSGAVSFVSKAWGWRVSDQEFTKRSGLLGFVEEGHLPCGQRISL